MATIELPDELTPELRDILGFMCFQLGKMAHAYQAAGRFVGADDMKLEKRAEDEQAFMLHRFLVHWAKAGDDWRASFADELDEVIAPADPAQGEG
jgi:hypothetical protein